jgi:hypothetical protein
LDGASLSFDIAHTRPAAALPETDETDPDEEAAAAAEPDPDPESRCVVLAAAEEGARARQESTAMTEERPRMIFIHTVNYSFSCWKFSRKNIEDLSTVALPLVLLVVLVYAMERWLPTVPL